MDMYANLVCPECGCTEVAVLDDGTAECLGCGFISAADVFIGG